MTGGYSFLRRLCNTELLFENSVFQRLERDAWSTTEDLGDVSRGSQRPSLVIVLRRVCVWYSRSVKNQTWLAPLQINCVGLRGNLGDTLPRQTMQQIVASGLPSSTRKIPSWERVAVPGYVLCSSSCAFLSKFSAFLSC